MSEERDRAFVHNVAAGAGAVIYESGAITFRNYKEILMAFPSLRAALRAAPPAPVSRAELTDEQRSRLLLTAESLKRSTNRADRVAAAGLAGLLAVSPTDDDPTTKAQYRRMFHEACSALGLINEKLGLDPEDGGADPILSAIDELQEKLAVLTAHVSLAELTELQAIEARQVAEWLDDDGGNPRAADVVRHLLSVIQPAPLNSGAEEAPVSRAEPLDMVLHCPACGLQHIDALEPVKYADTGSNSSFELNPERWQNPPHRSHLCHGCGHIWRPADVATNGVQAVKTQGKADSPIAQSAPLTNEGGGEMVPLRIEFEPGYPEDVAFGTQRQMDRLKKWLDKFFALRDAPRQAQGVEPVINEGGKCPNCTSYSTGPCPHGAAPANEGGKGEGVASASAQKPVATVRVKHGGYAMELSTHVAYALPEGMHDLYARPQPVAINKRSGQ